MDIAAERAYPTPFGNSPLLPLLLLSLATQRHVPRTRTNFKKEYDYIIVGAGAAGSTLASRLSEKPCVSVLLLEAGTGNLPLLNEVPSISRSFWASNLDWNYKTEPQKHTAKSLVNGQLVWPSGKGLGGSTLLHSNLFIRGNRKNYDDWEAQGATGWSFQDIFPYFLKMEDNRDPEYVLNGYHGVGGPLSVERTKYQAEIKNSILESAQGLGLEIVDSNAARQTGVFEFQATFRNGQRCSTAKAYLVPAENRTNLHIVTGAHVKKILLQKRRAIGVQFDFRNATCVVKARREVIMSAGTTNTAQLLMLSGIGPKEQLQKFKIPCVADLPVGKNLQNRCASFLTYQLNPKIPTIKQKLENPENIKEYIHHRTGPLASSDFYTNMAFLHSYPVPHYVDFPDFHIYFKEITEDFPRKLNMNPEIYKVYFGPYENCPMFVCQSQLLQPKSRGTVTLKSTNPYDPPAIDPNYLADPEDVRVTVEGMKACQKILMSDSMKKVGAKPLETIFPGCEKFFGNDEHYFTCLARNLVVTRSHMVGTVKMGNPRDPTTVVDPLLRVKGIKNLRVVDASVMPIVTSGNTNAPTIMIAEKASDILKELISCGSPSSYDDTEYSDIYNLYDDYISDE